MLKVPVFVAILSFSLYITFSSASSRLHRATITYLRRLSSLTVVSYTRAQMYTMARDGYCSDFVTNLGSIRTTFYWGHAPFQIERKSDAISFFANLTFLTFALIMGWGFKVGARAGS
jgi:hypothetical protein